MTLDEAITTALDYEGKVYKTYMDAAEQAHDEVAMRVFRALANEEKGHISYLGERLQEWKSTGSITLWPLETSVPDRETIAQGVKKLRAKLQAQPSARSASEVVWLQRALQVEVETSAFYKEMVRTLDAEGQQMFARFVEIEEGHVAIVQAEIDCVSGLGFWFDSREFTLEG